MTLSFFSSISNDTRLLSLLDMMYNDAQDRLARFIVEGDLLKYVCKLGNDWIHFSSTTFVVVHNGVLCTRNHQNMNFVSLISHFGD